MKCILALGLFAISLIQVAGCPIETENTRLAAIVTTSMGEFTVELDPQNAPVTVLNFTQYVEDGYYDGTIFHRVVPGFVVQGGGFMPDLTPRETRPPIRSEANNGLLNLRGTIAMARASDPNSATAQFFVNLVDNPDLDAGPDNPGYTVFGRVIDGMDVIDRMVETPTEDRGGFTDVPVDDIIIESVDELVLPAGYKLTPDAEQHLTVQSYEAMSLMRELLVQFLGLTIASL